MALEPGNIECTKGVSKKVWDLLQGRLPAGGPTHVWKIVSYCVAQGLCTVVNTTKWIQINMIDSNSQPAGRVIGSDGTGGANWIPGGGGGSNFVLEDLTSQINGIATQFQTSNNYVAGTLEVYVNGAYQGRPPTHFTEVPPDKFNFLDWTLTVGEELFVRYQT